MMGHDEYLQAVKAEWIQFLIYGVVPLHGLDLVMNIHQQREAETHKHNIPSNVHVGRERPFSTTQQNCTNSQTERSALG